MILVDTCVWIDYLRGKQTPAAGFLANIVGRADVEISISSIIYFEVLRGIPDPRQRKLIASIFNKLEWRNYDHDSIDEMLHYDVVCRRHGIILPKLGDWLIIQTALDHHLEVLTSDKDFDQILPYVPLRIVQLSKL